MSKRFLKFIPSEAAIQFAIKYKNAFVLLMIIAERARRKNGNPDGLTIGQCHLGNHKNYGMTEKEYRYAKQILIEQGLIKIVVTNRTRKKAEKTQNMFFSKNGANVGATEPTTYGTLVEILDSTVWDINSEYVKDSKGDRKGDSRATEGRLKGDKQEGIRKNKNSKKPTNQPNLPSEVLSSVVEEAGRSAGSSELRKEAKEWLLNAKFKEIGAPQEKFSLEEIERILVNFSPERILEVKKFIGQKSPKERSKIQSEKGYFKKALFEGWK